MSGDDPQRRRAHRTSNAELSRRSLLRTAGTGVAALTVSSLASSSAAAAGAPFGDGVNLQPAYYCNGEQDLGWDLMNQYSDIQTVRIEIEPPSWGESQASLEESRRWIDEAASNGYEVVATCHHYPYNGESNEGYLYEAADWWVDNYDYLSANSSFTINLMNEWGGHDVSVDQYATAYNEAVSRVRQVYGGTIVCDVPGWGQNTHAAADAASQLEDDDLVLSVHIYPSAYNETAGEWLQPDHLDYLDGAGYPCMVGEFGANRDGDADWSGLIDHAKSLGWPVVGWAWNGDGESDPMNMASPGWIDQPCASSYTTSSYFDVVYDKLGGDDGGGGNCEPTSIDPYLNVDGSGWENTNDATIDQGSSVEFGPHPYDTDGSWSWSGSGVSASTREIEVTPSETSTYTATYTNECGETSSHDFTVFVEGSGDDGSGDDGNDGDSSDVIAQFDPSTTNAAAGERITFQAEDTSGSDRWIASLEWDFGDGSTATGWWAEHTYGSGGSYAVGLTATDDQGASTTYEVTISVS